MKLPVIPYVIWYKWFPIKSDKRNHVEHVSEELYSGKEAKDKDENLVSVKFGGK